MEHCIFSNLFSSNLVIISVEQLFVRPRRVKRFEGPRTNYIKLGVPLQLNDHWGRSCYSKMASTPTQRWALQCPCRNNLNSNYTNSSRNNKWSLCPVSVTSSTCSTINSSSRSSSNSFSTNNSSSRYSSNYSSSSYSSSNYSSSFSSSFSSSNYSISSYNSSNYNSSSSSSSRYLSVLKPHQGLVWDWASNSNDELFEMPSRWKGSEPIGYSFKLIVRAHIIPPAYYCISVV